MSITADGTIAVAATLLIVVSCLLIVPRAAKTFSQQTVQQLRSLTRREKIVIPIVSVALAAVLVPLMYALTQASPIALVVVGYVAAGSGLLSLFTAERRKQLIVALLLCGVLGFWLWDQNWLTVDLMVMVSMPGMLSLIGSGKSLPLGTFRMYALIGMALVVYDVAMVYATDYMLEMVRASIAHGLPSMLQYPRSWALDAQPLTALGTGDLIVPGMIIISAWTLGVRHDLPWFKWAAMAGYVCGIVVSGIVLRLTGHPQPALLFLCPSVILAVTIAAARSGHLTVLWGSSRAPEKK